MNASTSSSVPKVGRTETLGIVVLYSFIAQDYPGLETHLWGLTIPLAAQLLTKRANTRLCVLVVTRLGQK